jgi:L-alanine-DL-glutamate epimerase-like enolase superfamily enzyme
MKITRLTTHIVHCEIPEEHRVRSGAGLKLARQAAFVEIETDEGITGVGPCSFGSASVDLFIVQSVIERAISPMLVGRDPAEIETLWNEIYYGVVTRVLGHRGMGVAVLSGLDIALWDIKGKVADLPVYSLLGGPSMDRVRCYGSSIYWSTPEEAAATAREFLDEGFGAVKLKVGVDVRQDLDSLAAIREEVGPDVDIMVDANQNYSADLAIKVGRELEKYNVLFFEEPISIDDIAGHKHLADALDTRIATGENLYTRWGFLPFIQSRAADVVQPDASRTGGISEARRIADLAAAFHSYSAPHTFSDAFSVLANLHVMAATANTIILELDRTYNPLMTDLVAEPIRPVDGFLDLPTAPGIGLTLDRDFVADHPYNGELGISAGGQPAVGMGSEVLADRAARTLQSHA